MSSERSELLPRKSSETPSGVSLSRVALGCVAVVIAVAGFIQLTAASPSGRYWVEDGVRMGQSGGQMTKFVLRTRCIPDSVKATNPNFFREGTNITGAMIVRHNLGTPSFFPPFEDGFVMTPVTYDMTGYEWDWEEGRFFLETDQVDWEWGFALVNSEGEYFYEIGDGAGKPLWGSTCPDVIHFDSPTQQFFNRLFTDEKGAGSKVSYVFGSCDEQCPARPFMEWSPYQRQLATEKVKSTPPNQAGSEFVMYGTAGEGVCQFDIMGKDNYNPDNHYEQDRLLHFAPDDAEPKCHTNTRRNKEWRDTRWFNDPWPFGPRGDPTSTYKWRYRILVEEAGLRSLVCPDWSAVETACVEESFQPYTFGYTPSDIYQVAVHPVYDTNLIKNDKCEFYSKYPGRQKNPNY